jgi:hypothetical protein
MVKRQTIQCSRVRRYQRIIRSRKSKTNRQCNDLELEDNKGVLRSRKSKKDRQYNGLELEDTKGILRSVNQRRIDNKMF